MKHMKQLFFVALAAIFGIQTSQAQEQEIEYGLFNHLGAGLSLGTDGIGLEVSSTITDFLGVRLGYSFMPGIKYKGNFDFDSSEGFLRKEDGSGYYDNVDVEGKLHMGDLKLLFDLYPSKKSSFRFTVGAYIGKSKLVTAKNTNHFINESYWGNSGPELGKGIKNYTIVSDKNGVINADLKTNTFKPYLGVGFGRDIPRKSRLTVSFDFGVQFWGTPSLWTDIDVNMDTRYRKIEKDRILSEQDWVDDFKDGIDIMEKVFVYPVISLRLNGRIF